MTKHGLSAATNNQQRTFHSQRDVYAFWLLAIFQLKYSKTRSSEDIVYYSLTSTVGLRDVARMLEGVICLSRPTVIVLCNMMQRVLLSMNVEKEMAKVEGSSLI